MNRTVVRRAAAGVAAWLAAREPGARVVVGYDARHGSHDFAHDSAAIFAAAGFDARVLPRLLPTPVLAFAVQHLGAAAGVMVTASHNPPQDNGYKVYVGDGAQIAPPTDAEIEAAIRAVGPSRRDRDVGRLLGARRVDRRRLCLGHRRAGRHRVRATCASSIPRCTAWAPRCSPACSRPPDSHRWSRWPQQAAPDPDFPTVSFPNPEEPGALDLALALARDEHADIVIANDPDADRCAVAVIDGGQWRMLRGDEVGVLLADTLLDKGIRGTYATTIVSSTMLKAIAERHRVGYAETLTGFKWISRAAPDLVYGYEEALGYAVAPDLVRDKDGISAALLVAERAAALKAAGSSLPQRLDELAAEYGRYATDQLAMRVDDLSIISDTMRQLRATPPATLLGEPVTVTDRLPEADVVTLTWAGGRVVVRPVRHRAEAEGLPRGGRRRRLARRGEAAPCPVGARGRRHARDQFLSRLPACQSDQRTFQSPKPSQDGIALAVPVLAYVTTSPTSENL